MADMTDTPTDAIAALTNYQQQLDEGGGQVGVSRQALDEVLAYLARPQAAPPADPRYGKLHTDGSRSGGQRPGGGETQNALQAIRDITDGTPSANGYLAIASIIDRAICGDQSASDDAPTYEYAGYPLSYCRKSDLSAPPASDEALVEAGANAICFVDGAKECGCLSECTSGKNSHVFLDYARAAQAPILAQLEQTYYDRDARIGELKSQLAEASLCAFTKHDQLTAGLAQLAERDAKIARLTEALGQIKDHYTDTGRAAKHMAAIARHALGDQP